MSAKQASGLKRPRYEMPDDVREALLAQGLMAAYRNRPPYQQNDYIGWITRAVRPETRQRQPGGGSAAKQDPVPTFLARYFRG